MSDDIFLARIEDLIRLCEKYRTPRFSAFLDEREQAAVQKSGILKGANHAFFGGFKDAERKILGVFPDWEEADTEGFPIAALEFSKKYEKELSHRNYLGTILSLGIDRSKIGDILVFDKGAYVFVSADIEKLISDEIYKVAGCGVEIAKRDFSEIVPPEKKTEEITAISASTRLDAVLAAVLKISRSEAKTVILSGRVSVNHFEESRADKELYEGDLLSIRAFGRVRLFKIGGKTRSDRIHITLKKYI